MALINGTSTALTITAANLASGSARSSAAVTTGATQNLTDILLTVNALTTATAPSGNKQIIVYGYASEDGTNYSGDSGTVDNVDGTDKALTALGSPTNLVFLGTVYCAQGAAAVTVHGVFSVARAFGFIPRKWGIVLYNDLGTALGATISATYSEQYYN
ncbi:MAG: hypothetical protein WC856_02530 [Methylococcaceae bacterium]|jgi:hypothetical protein